MKIVYFKPYVTLGLLLALFFAGSSCMEQAPVREAVEMTFRVSSPEELTKGIVTGSDLVDAVTGARPLVVSAFLRAQSGVDENYFVAQVFSKSGDIWHRDGEPVYWPMGGSLDMMAYSSTTPFAASSVTWAPHNAASRVRLFVDEGRTQDDIMFGVAYDSHMDDVSGTGYLGMNHAQAWVEATLQKQSGNGHAVTVTKVELVDAYIGGELTIENDHGYPKVSWDMRRFTARSVVIDDLSGVYGSAITTTPKSVGFLVPQQEMCSIRVTYTVDGVKKTAVKELQHAYWLMGHRYTYSFVFDPS